MMKVTSEEGTLSVSAQWPPRADRRDRLAEALQPHGFRLTSEEPHAHNPILLTFARPGEDDFATVARLSQDGLRRLIVALEDPAAMAQRSARRLLTHGASEVCCLSEILTEPAGLCARLRRWGAIDRIVCSSLVRDNLPGASPSWILLLRHIVEVAHFSTSPVILIGETGTGKGRLARLIHTLDNRATKCELVALDCSTLMLESRGGEFVRQVSYATRSAYDDALALAHNGTLLLKNVEKLPTSLQLHLLRVIEERKFRRLGARHQREMEFRLVCSTQRDLRIEIHRGNFSPHLYYRLAGWEFRVPGLGERPDDILPLARHLWTQLRPNMADIAFTPAVITWLQERRYPGNIHDLRQVMTRLAERHLGPGAVGLADLPEDESPNVLRATVPWPDASFKHAVERATALGFGPHDIGLAASELALQTSRFPKGPQPERTKHLGAINVVADLCDLRVDTENSNSSSRVEPVATAHRKVILRPAETASHTEPMPLDPSGLPRPIIPRNNEEEAER